MISEQLDDLRDLTFKLLRSLFFFLQYKFTYFWRVNFKFKMLKNHPRVWHLREEYAWIDWMGSLWVYQRGWSALGSEVHLNCWQYY